jgi:hypothetical protein
MILTEIHLPPDLDRQDWPAGTDVGLGWPDIALETEETFASFVTIPNIRRILEDLSAFGLSPEASTRATDISEEEAFTRVSSVYRPTVLPHFRVLVIAREFQEHIVYLDVMGVANEDTWLQQSTSFFDLLMDHDLRRYVDAR